MRVADAVRATRESGSAQISLSASLGFPSFGQENFAGEGVVDFQADRARVSEQMVTPRIEGRSSQGVLRRHPAKLVLGFSNWVIGSDAFYEGGARWTLRRGRWRGPKGDVAGPKTTWHPLFILELLQADTRSLSDGQQDLFSDVEVTRHEIQIGSDQGDPAAWRSWVMSQPSEITREPRSILWVANSGLVHGVAYEAVLGDDDENGLWKCARLWSFGRSTEELDRIGAELVGQSST
jgi:hypothetical protein